MDTFPQFPDNGLVNYLQHRHSLNKEEVEKVRNILMGKVNITYIKEKSMWKFS